MPKIPTMIQMTPDVFIASPIHQQTVTKLGFCLALQCGHFGLPKNANRRKSLRHHPQVTSQNLNHVVTTNCGRRTSLGTTLISFGIASPTKRGEAPKRLAPRKESPPMRKECGY